MPYYEVAQGDCISSIADDHGLFWQTIWNHPENRELKQQRDDPNVLSPGDVVFVPEKEVKVESRATDARHRFKRKGIPEFLTLRFLDDLDHPRAGEAYIACIDGKWASGRLDSKGACSIPICPGGKSGNITLGDPNKGEIYDLDLGCIDPITSVSGVEARLYNLGYLDSVPSGQDSPELADAVKAFQLDQGISASAGVDDPTRQRLLEVHGS